MGKKRQRAGTKEDNQCKDQHYSIDRISMLPDDVLVSILFFLTLKEAAATSILSRRWRHLWTFIPTLDFDGTEQLSKVESAKTTRRREVLDEERRKYVEWVNHVLALHKSSTIKELRISFNLNKTHKRAIEEWLIFALARKVQRLELKLTVEGSASMVRLYNENFTFPHKLLRIAKQRFSNRLLAMSVITRECNSIDFKYLKSISMNYVNVNGEALEFFLCNCPLLEHLSLSHSGELRTLKICGHHSLKRLEIGFCYHLNSVQIRDSNLVYLKYEGYAIDFLLENVPLLVEIFVGEIRPGKMEDVISMLSSCLRQLEILTIEKSEFSWADTDEFLSAVKMSNLKQLVVKTYTDDSWPLLPLTNLIHASPCLQKFVLEASWLSQPRFFIPMVRKPAGGLYTHLREVEFVGYYGRKSDLELVMHFLEHAVALEKIVIDPRNNWSNVHTSVVKNDKQIEEEMAAKTRAMDQLTGKVPPRVTLQIC